MTHISEFDYFLPKERIAHKSVFPRDRSKLMLLNRKTGEIQHKIFYQILDELCEGDVLVFNNSKVFKARLMGRKIERKERLERLEKLERREGLIEIFLLKCVFENETSSVWETLIKPGKKIKKGDEIEIFHQKIFVLEKREDGIVVVKFCLKKIEVIDFANIFGSIPIPPYVEKIPDSESDYQTVYAKEVGSVAAPTAGFHFTEELLEKLKEKGIQILYITLHVGIGTFRPVQTENIEDHKMHEEFVEISKETARIINQAKKEKRKVIAVGTTTVRSLEGVARLNFENGNTQNVLCSDGFVGNVNLFIQPGFEFKVIDGLITNFHLPKSTLLILISSFAGRENVRKAYQTAILENYRFFSFGDSMFIR